MQSLQDRFPNIQKLRWFTLIVTAVTLGLVLLNIISYGFYLGAYIRYILWPLYGLAFVLIKDEQKQKIVANKIAWIICYALFGAWFVWGVIDLINTFSYFVLFPFLMVVSYIVNSLFAALYFHLFRLGAGDGSTPLLSA